MTPPAAPAKPNDGQRQNQFTMISHYAGPGEALTWTRRRLRKMVPQHSRHRRRTRRDPIQQRNHELQLHDLQGNIVATVGTSETETKLLSTYNSTEFGVPGEGKTPPKYAWLGADGITSTELPSNTIVHDGITYVPLTGEPLQTEPVELPQPVQYYAPFERPNAEGATWGPIAAGLDIAEARAAAGALQPRKAVEASDEFGGSSCSGSGACASSYVSCGLHMKFGEPFGNELWAVAKFNCSRKVPYFQLEVCILVENIHTHVFENLHDDPCNHEGAKAGRV